MDRMCSLMELSGRALWGALIALTFVTSAEAQLGPVMSATGAINRSMGGTATAAPLSAGGALMWNPATLAGLETNEIEIGAELIFPHASLHSEIPAGAFGPLGPPVDLAGTTHNEDAVFAVPTLALAYRPENSPITYGLGAFAVAGYGLNYAGSLTNPLLTPPPPGGLGFGPLFSQYQVLQIAPSLVYSVNEEFSLSISPLVNIGQAQLDPAIFAAPDDANGDGFASYPGGTHSRQSWGGGFHLGAYYQLTDWGFGASYKSQQWFESYQFNLANELGMPRSAEFNLNLPATVSLGASYRGLDGILLALDVRYLDFANTAGFGDSGFSPTGALRGVGLDSIVAVSLGAQFQWTDSFSSRIGYSWSDNPVKSDQASANVASPLVIENMLSSGLSYQVNHALAVSVAYTHAFENSVSGPVTLPGGAIPGTRVQSTASVDMVTVGATVKF